MSACISWEGDCNAYAPPVGMHGCKHPVEKHPGKAHECLCGALQNERYPRARKKAA